MKLSIITINYNDAEGLSKTMQSVLNQTASDFEYIVVDGASKDASVSVIESLADQLKKKLPSFKWVSEPDTGIYNAMNKGARMASGEYMLFLNSGDFLCSTTSIAEAVQQGFAADIVSGATIDFDDSKECLKEPPQHISLYSFIGGSLPHPSTFIQRDLFWKVGGYIEEYKIMSDWCFFVDALIVHNCSYTTIPVTVTRFNCYGISSTSAHVETGKSQEFLYKRFGRVMYDYIPVGDEALTNCMYWFFQAQGWKRTVLLFPFKVLNRIFHLRNRLSKRTRVTRIR